MSKKKILVLTNIMLIILTGVAGIYFKMKYDEKEERKPIYYKEQQKHIVLYLKHSTIEPNTTKSIHFTDLEISPMGSAMVEGYINGNKKDNLTAYATPKHNYRFGGTAIGGERLSELLKSTQKLGSPGDIKKKLNKKKDH